MHRKATDAELKLRKAVYSATLKEVRHPNLRCNLSLPLGLFKERRYHQTKQDTEGDDRKNLFSRELSRHHNR